ncbi:MAG: antitoxin, partial [Catenulispora sp.]|nr:antitoxin [Catenulispora sp.]
AESRSAAVHAAINLARSLQLADDYAAAFDEWEASGDAELWEAVAGDGLAE